MDSSNVRGLPCSMLSNALAMNLTFRYYQHVASSSPSCHHSYRPGPNKSSALSPASELRYRVYWISTTFLIRPSLVSPIDDSQTEPESDLSDDDKTELETQYSGRISPSSGSKGCPNINVGHNEVAVSGLIILVSGAPVWRTQGSLEGALTLFGLWCLRRT